MNNQKRLSREHVYLLSLLDCGPMDIRTLTNVSFGTRKRIKGLIEDLVVQDRIVQIWDKGVFLYRKV